MVLVEECFILHPTENEIKICANKNSLDYRILQGWIKKID